MRFLLVGVGSTVIHILVLLMMVKMFAMPMSGANALAFIAATAWSYLLNTFWTFTVSLASSNFLRFVIVSIAMAGMSAIFGFIADINNWPVLAPALMSVFLLPPITYLLHSRWSYK